MKLIEYLEKNNLKTTEFARMIGISHSTIYEVTHRGRKPSESMALQIEAATHGLVTVTELRSEVAE